MNLYITINVVFLCILNILFTFTGIFLNSVVIISFWMSSQLRKKTCYFMVFVLACYDLAVSSVNHPLLTVEAFMWYRREPSIFLSWQFVAWIRLVLYSNSCITLLGMNVERYIALMFPFFHQKSVTRQRVFTIVLITQLAFDLLLFLGFVQENETYYNILILLSHALLLILMSILNYKLLKIAKKMQRKVTVPACAAHSRVLENRKISMQIKNISTCVLAVGCLLLFSLPSFIFTGLSITSIFTEDSYRSFHLWECSLLTTNATFNCLIFFWKNNTLRSEGKKIVKSCLCFSR